VKLFKYIQGKTILPWNIFIHCELFAISTTHNADTLYVVGKKMLGVPSLPTRLSAVSCELVERKLMRKKKNDV
jgi:hypothetical protein